MRVRGAGGLLLGVVLYQVGYTLEIVSRGFGLVESFKRLLWYGGEFAPPADTQFFFIVRDVLLVGALVAAVLGLAGLRASRVPLALAAGGIALGLLPWAVYDFNDVRFQNLPPDWVLDHPIWYNHGRWTSLMWMVVCSAVVLMAVTDRVPGPSPAAGPPSLTSQAAPDHSPPP